MQTINRFSSSSVMFQHVSACVPKKCHASETCPMHGPSLLGWVPYHTGTCACVHVSGVTALLLWKSNLLACRHCHAHVCINAHRHVHYYVTLLPKYLACVQIYSKVLIEVMYRQNFVLKFCYSVQHIRRSSLAVAQSVLVRGHAAV